MVAEFCLFPCGIGSSVSRVSCVNPPLAVLLSCWGVLFAVGFYWGGEGVVVLWVRLSLFVVLGLWLLVVLCEGVQRLTHILAVCLSLGHSSCSCKCWIQ